MAGPIVERLDAESNSRLPGDAVEHDRRTASARPTPGAESPQTSKLTRTHGTYCRSKPKYSVLYPYGAELVEMCVCIRNLGGRFQACMMSKVASNSYPSGQLSCSVKTNTEHRQAMSFMFFYWFVQSWLLTANLAWRASFTQKTSLEKHGKRSSNIFVGQIRCLFAGEKVQ